MKVWIVSVCERCEGCGLLGVFGSRHGAEAFADSWLKGQDDLWGWSKDLADGPKQYAGTKSGVDYLTVVEWEVQP